MGLINDLRINNLQPGCFRIVASRRQERPSTSADVASAPGDEPLDLGAAGLLQRLGLCCPPPPGNITTAQSFKRLAQRRRS